MKSLMSHAAELGVSVHVAHLPAPYRGFYDSETHRVIYDFNLTPIERRCVLAHELGHAFYDHQCQGNLAFERAADLYAARLLIDPDLLAALGSQGTPLQALADELMVEARLLKLFIATDLWRAGDTTYVRPRLGGSQLRIAADFG